MIIAYDNKILNSTITPFIDSPALPMETALKDARLSRVGRLVALTGQYITFDFGQAEPVNLVAIFNHNFTSSAVVHIQGNSSDSWGAPIVDEVVPISENIFYRITGDTLRYWRVTIEDPTNPLPYIEIGGIFLGPYYTAPGILADPVTSRPTTSTVQFSESGQIFSNRGITYEVYSVTFPAFDFSTKTEFENIFSIVDITNPFYMVLFEKEPFAIQPRYAVFVNNFEFQKLSEDGGLWSAAVTFREVK